MKETQRSGRRTRFSSLCESDVVVGIECRSEHEVDPVRSLSGKFRNPSLRLRVHILEQLIVEQCKFVCITELQPVSVVNDIDAGRTAITYLCAFRVSLLCCNDDDTVGSLDTEHCRR